MKDLVLQGPQISGEALDTFKVVCSPARITTAAHSARCTGVRDDPQTRKAVAGLASYWKLDTAFVDPAASLTDFRLLAMDMDSTLINIESLDEVATYAGKGAEVAAITEAAMRGEIADYKDSLRRRVAMLAGTDAALLQRVLDEKLQLNSGAKELIRACQRRSRRRRRAKTAAETRSGRTIRSRIPSRNERKEFMIPPSAPRRGCSCGRVPPPGVAARQGPADGQRLIL